MVTRRNNRKKLWWGGGILIVIVAVVVVVIVVNKNRELEPVKKQEQKQDQIIESTEKENESKGLEEQNLEELKKEDIKQYDGESPNKAEALTGVISYAGVVGDALIVRTNIDQYLAEGSCTLNLVQNDSTVYSEVVVIESSVSTSTCNGFQIPTSKFPAGKIMVEVTLESSGKYGKIEKELNI